MLRNPLKTWLTLVLIASAYGAATVHSSDFATLRRNALLLKRGSVECYRTTTTRRASKKTTASAYVAPAPVKSVTDVCSALEEFAKVITEIKTSTDRAGSLKKVRMAHVKLQLVLRNSKREEERKRIRELTDKVVGERLLASSSTPSTSTGTEGPRDSVATLKKSLKEFQKPCLEPPRDVCSALEQYAKEIDEIENLDDAVEKVKRLRRAHVKLQMVLRNSKREEERKRIRELSGKTMAEMLLPPTSASGTTAEDEARPDPFAALKSLLKDLRKPCEDPSEKVCSAVKAYALQIEEIGKPGDPVRSLERLRKAHDELQEVVKGTDLEKKAGEIRDLSVEVLGKNLVPTPSAPGTSSENGAPHDSVAELEEYLKELQEPCDKPETKVCSALREYAKVLAQVKKTTVQAVWLRDLRTAHVKLKIELEQHGRSEERARIRDLTTAFVGARSLGSGAAAGTNQAAELEKYLQTLLKQCKK